MKYLDALCVILMESTSIFSHTAYYKLKKFIHNLKYIYNLCCTQT